MSSQCIFVMQRPQAPGWDTPAAIEQCHLHERQPPCKIAALQLQITAGSRERTIRNVLNAAGLRYTINRQIVFLHGKLEGLEEVRLQHCIKLPMTPTEGASQLTIQQVTKANVSEGFQGVQYYCKVGTIEYLSTVRLQAATENLALCQMPLSAFYEQLQTQIGSHIEDLTLEQVSPDAGRSTQLVHTFLVAKDCPYLQMPPYTCRIQTPAQEEINIQLQHCGTRISLQPPRKAIIRVQDTMADVHDTLVGRHQALPSSSTKGQLLGVADTSAAESIARTQRVTVVDTYEGLSKTRVLVVRDNLAAVAVDAQIDTREAHDLYEKLNLTKWRSRQHTNQQQPQQVTNINLSEEYYQRYRHNENSLIHTPYESTARNHTPCLSSTLTDEQAGAIPHSVKQYSSCHTRPSTSSCPCQTPNSSRTSTLNQHASKLLDTSRPEKQREQRPHQRASISQSTQNHHGARQPTERHPSRTTSLSSITDASH